MSQFILGLAFMVLSLVPMYGGYAIDKAHGFRLYPWLFPLAVVLWIGLFGTGMAVALTASP